MKVLLLNGSPKANGNTALALKEMAAIFEKEGIEAEIIHVGNREIRGCIACGSCKQICPQKIDIPAALRDFADRMEKLPSWAEICRERDEAPPLG